MNNGIEGGEWANDIAPIRPDYETNDYLQLMGLNISDFEGKKVASIGGGFGILEMDLAKTGKTTVEIIDPIFRDKTKVEQIIQNTHNNFYRIEKDRRDSYYMYSSIFTKETQEKIYDLLCKINKQRLYLNELKNNFTSDKLPNTLILNPSFGESIKGIEPNSQDYVFINNLLFRFPTKINIFLSQADKILKEGGTIFIIDYNDKLTQLQEYLKKNGTYKQDSEDEDGAFCGSLKKGEFKEIKL